MRVDQTLSLSADNASGIDNLCSVENDAYYNYFFNSIKVEFDKLGLQDVSASINKLLEQIIDMGEQDRHE